MRNNKAQIKKISLLSVLTAAAMILSYVEAVIPPLFSAVPGIKIGLPNVIIIFILYRMGISAAATVSFVRIFLSALLFGSPISLLFSIMGAIFSLAVMLILKKSDLFSTVGVSVAGGVFHNVGQILTAMLVLDTMAVGYYLIVLAVTGTIAGIFVGLCGAFLIKRI